MSRDPLMVNGMLDGLGLSHYMLYEITQSSDPLLTTGEPSLSRDSPTSPGKSSIFHSVR